MNTFTLLTVVGALGVVVSFLAGCSARRENLNENLRAKGAEDRHKLFGLAVALTILSALLAH